MVALEDVFSRHMPQLMFIWLITAPFSLGLVWPPQRPPIAPCPESVNGTRAVTV